MRHDGVEATLRVLLRQGVYVTIDEFKARKPAMRGSTSVAITPDSLRNPQSTFHVAARSGGSRSDGTPVFLDLTFIRECAANNFLGLDARGGGDWVKAIWEGPGAGATFRVLLLLELRRPARALVLTDRRERSRAHPRYRWHARIVSWESRLIGVPLPGPEYVPIDDPTPIARWMAARSGEAARRTCSASRAPPCACVRRRSTRASTCAARSSSSPASPRPDARLETIRRAGAEAVPRYGSIECGSIGYACFAPEAPDDLHFFDDLHAIVQPGDDTTVRGRARRRAVHHVTALQRAVRDAERLDGRPGRRCSRRACGCPMERLGWTTHLHTIRSYEKLTGAGITLFDTDVVRVLEDVLPRSDSAACRRTTSSSRSRPRRACRGYGCWCIPPSARSTRPRWRRRSSGDRRAAQTASG